MEHESSITEDDSDYSSNKKSKKIESFQSPPTLVQPPGHDDDACLQPAFVQSTRPPPDITVTSSHVVLDPVTFTSAPSQLCNVQKTRAIFQPTAFPML